MKIGVYAPFKNASHHVQDWVQSCRDADYICVADTGSTDDTIEKLESYGVSVTKVCLRPFRFDHAFNISMSLLPSDTDVLIRLDSDERLQPNWRTSLESAWTPETTQLRYPYIWNWVNGKP